jgi:hypothetical protein
VRECGGSIYGAVEEVDGRGAAGNGGEGRRRRGEEGGAAAGGRGRPRQVGPTCRWPREREGGEAGRAGRVGRKMVGPAGIEKGRGVGRGVGLFCFFLFFLSFLFLKSILKPISNLLNSNLLHVFKLKF